MAQKRKRLACESATTELFASATEEAHIALSPEPAPQLQGDGKIEEEDPINDPLIYQYRKRVPMREPGGKQDIFVSRSTRFGALKARAISLLDSGSQPVFLHAMGAAITLCCNLALTIQAECGGHVMLGVQTTTVQVYDDYEPLEEGYPEVTRSRSKSGVRIKIVKTPDYV